MQIQIGLFDWAEANMIFHPELELLHFVPNEIKLESQWEGYWLNKAGRKAGMPDVHLPVARLNAIGQLYIGFVMEIKRDVSQRPRKDQQHFLDLLNHYGHFATSCHSEEEAIETLEWYLSLEKPKTEA